MGWLAGLRIQNCGPRGKGYAKGGCPVLKEGKRKGGGDVRVFVFVWERGRGGERFNTGMMRGKGAGL